MKIKNTSKRGLCHLHEWGPHYDDGMDYTHIYFVVKEYYILVKMSESLETE